MHSTPRRIIRHSSFVIRCGGLLAVSLALSGCTTTSLFSGLSRKAEFSKATPNNPAVRCLCLWEPAEGTGVDDRPARGVAGQIFFFTRSSVTPVEVDGDVRIFLFDDQGESEDQSVPLHQFDFLNGSWNAQLTATQFGPAYQVFVPYSRKGHHLATLALRVRLTPKNGPVIFSDMANVVLHGFDRSKAEAESEKYEPLPRNVDAPRGESSAANVIPTKQFEQAWQQTLAKQSADLRKQTGQRVSSTNRNTGRESTASVEPPCTEKTPARRRSQLTPDFEGHAEEEF